jgi:hypothetical protein
MYYFSIGAIFKNEAHIIKEWIKYYLSQGVEHFYLIDNGSTDNYIEQIKEYETYIDLFVDSKKNSQNELYTKYILPKSKEETVWLGIFDLDEFTYNQNGYKMCDILKTHFNENVNQIWCPWVIFGSNNHITQPDSVIHGFIKRKKINGSQGKCIFKPKYATNIFAHGADINVKDEILCYFNKEIIKRNNFDYNLCQEENINDYLLIVNHYMFQSLDFYTNIKCGRGDAWHIQNNRKPSDVMYVDNVCNIIDNKLSKLVITNI